MEDVVDQDACRLPKELRADPSCHDPAVDPKPDATGRTAARGAPAPRYSLPARLDPARQALLVLAHLRNGDTPARLADGFGVSLTTAWRYIREAVDLLAATAHTLAEAMTSIARLAYAILDGTLIPIDRVANQMPYCSGKHRRHGVKAQVIADAAGRLRWLSAALPGSTHDLSVPREHGIVEALTTADVMAFADKGYQGAGGSVRTPFKRYRRRRRLSRREKAVNRGHARIRAVGERAIATLKCWKLLTKVHCCPKRVTALLAAILVLQLVEEQR
uniref:Transposase IS4 family protein n=1 Tax=Salinispora arenicola (strain CNS-205) TaxID=391037 RepID=A8M6V9_SALAI